MNTENASVYQTKILGASFGNQLDTLYIERIVNELREQPNSFWDSKIHVTNTFIDRQQSTASSQNTTQFQRIIVDSTDINQFIDFVDVSCLESGYVSRAELFVKSLCHSKGEAYVMQMMNDIYIKYPRNELLMCVVINLLSDIEYEKLGSFAITLCMGLIAVGTPMVWEYVTNACDRWKSKDFIPCLQGIVTESLLLKRMINKVIARLQQ
ncbi:MAG: hypothetical protein ACI4CT_08020 [Lachnospiraceae bacterium]